MADELWNILMRFHREVAFPEIVGTLHQEIATRHRETQANFDAAWTHFDRLESEYHTPSAAMTRVEGRVARLEDKSEPLDQE